MNCMIFRAEVEGLQKKIEEVKRGSSDASCQQSGRIFEAALKVGGIDAGAVYLVNDAGWVEMIMHKGLSPRLSEGCAQCAPDSPRARIVRAEEWLYRDSAYIAGLQFEDLREEGLRALADFLLSAAARPLQS